MEFNEYQQLANGTSVYKQLEIEDRKLDIIYPALGLAGETGEVLEKVKKLFRDKKGKIDAEFLLSITKELGDVLWYIAALASDLGLSLNDIAENNITKLFTRATTSSIHGDGDDREMKIATIVTPLILK